MPQNLGSTKFFCVGQGGGILKFGGSGLLTFPTPTTEKASNTEQGQEETGQMVIQIPVLKISPCDPKVVWLQNSQHNNY